MFTILKNDVLTRSFVFCIGFQIFGIEAWHVTRFRQKLSLCVNFFTELYLDEENYGEMENEVIYIQSNRRT